MTIENIKNERAGIIRTIEHPSKPSQVKFLKHLKHKGRQDKEYECRLTEIEETKVTPEVIINIENN